MPLQLLCCSSLAGGCSAMIGRELPVQSWPPPWHKWDCSLVILVHPILAVEVEGVAAERAAEDVVKLVVKQALREEEQHGPGAKLPPLWSPCSPHVPGGTAEPAHKPAGLLPACAACTPGLDPPCCSQGVEHVEHIEHGASLVCPHLTPGEGEDPQSHVTASPFPSQNAQHLGTALGGEGREVLMQAHRAEE